MMQDHYTPKTNQVQTGLDTLYWLYERGATFCKVAAWNSKGTSPGKKPIEDDWQITPYTLEAIKPHLIAGGNVGMLAGKYSDNIGLLDLDENFTGFLQTFPHLAAYPRFEREGADKAKLLIRIDGEIPKGKKWYHKRGDKHPFCEWLSTGNQGVVAGLHPDTKKPYTLVNSDNEILELSPVSLGDICAVWCGGGFEDEPQAPQEIIKPKAITDNGSGDLKAEVLNYWGSPLKVFEHFGLITQAIRWEGRGKEWGRIFGNGGLFIHKDGIHWGHPGEQTGGDIFDAWQYCKTGTKAPRDKRFYTLLVEMAQAANITIPQAAKPKPQEPEPEAEAGAIPEPKTWADIRQLVGPVTWAWSNWIPDGMLTLVTSEPGKGKSALCLRLAGVYINGWPWPDGTPFEGERGRVLWCEAESAEAVNLDRAERWGINLEQMITPFIDPLDNTSLDRPDHKALITERALRPDVKLIIIDSLSGSDSKAEKSPEYADNVKWLAALARDCGKPVIVTHHLRKRGMFDLEDITLDRVRGTSAIVQYARLVWALDTPDSVNQPEAVRLKVIKSNLAPFPEEIGLKISAAGVSFGAAPEAPQVETVTDKAIDLLLALLSSEPIRYKKIEDEFKGAGISEATINRAKTKLGIVSIKKPDGWYWSLPAKEYEN